MGEPRSSADDLEHLFELSLDLLCIAGLDGFFRRVNPSWTRVLGWTEEEFLSRPVFDLLHPDDLEVTTAARAQLSNGVPLVGLTNRYRCKDGSYRWLEWRSVSSVERGLVYAAARDITARRESEKAQADLQRRLIVSDRLASVGTLAAGVAHEINNPLAYVMSNLDMAIEEIQGSLGASSYVPTKELEEMLVEAREGAERVSKIVRALRTFSRADEERRTSIELRPTLELAINMTFNEIRHRAKLVKNYGETPPIEADAARLGQVFVNLLVNAAQAIPLGAADANEIRITTSTDPTGRAVVEVRDTGAGIPDQLLGRIFDPFFTTKPVGVGTGLGLSICHSIMTAMGGDISVSSEVGRGTIFQVVIPAAPAAQPAPTALVPTPSSPERRAAVLVVDDEPGVGMALRRILRDHDVTVLMSGADALDVMAAGRQFDVIFSDLMMPQMTGMEFYRQVTLRSADVAARMVFMTGGAFTAFAHEFLDEVGNERIEKPFAPNVVRELVQKFLR